jgi:hypothetical protein
MRIWIDIYDVCGYDHLETMRLSEALHNQWLLLGWLCDGTRA